MPDKDLTRAGFGPRAAAYLIDRALLLIALIIVRAPFAVASLAGAGRLSENFIFSYSVIDVVCWLLTSAYFVMMTWFCGATLGKMVMRLQVRRGDGEPMRFIDVLYRETVGRFLSGILCIGYLMVLGDREKRAFHDWLCGTCVVYDGIRIPTREKPAAPAPELWSEPGDDAQIPSPDSPAPASMGWSLPGMQSAAPEAPGIPDAPADPQADIFTEEEGGA